MHLFRIYFCLHISFFIRPILPATVFHSILETKDLERNDMFYDPEVTVFTEVYSFNQQQYLYSISNFKMLRV